MDTIERLSEQVVRSAPEDETGLDALGILLLLFRRRRLIGIVTLISLIVGGVTAIILKPNFTANAVIMPPQQSSYSSALLGQLAPLASLGGSSGALGLKSPADMYVGILQSRTIADELISSFHLDKIYGHTKMQAARAALKSHSDIQAGKDGLIQISVTDHDPKRASDLANAYVSELYKMNANLAVTEAAQRRVFFDQQLEEERKALSIAEEGLRTTQQKTGLIQLSGQAEMIIRTIADLRAEIASREVELQSIRTFATEQNPDVTRLQQEISTMRAQLSKLENDQQRRVEPGNIAIPAGNVPEDSLEYSKKLREVRYHETLFDLLSRQYEGARIDEAKSAPIIQVIDHAIPPDTKSGPHRMLILLGFGLVGFLISCVGVLIQAGVDNIRTNPVKKAQWDALSKTNARSPYKRPL